MHSSNGDASSQGSEGDSVAPAGDRGAPLIACAWLFFWFLSYFIQRPLRDELGIVQGVENLDVVFLITAVVVLPANFLFSSFAGRRTAQSVIRTFTALVAVVLSAFAIGLFFVDENAENWLGRVFYVWVSLFNLFTISLFWGSMAQVFDGATAKRSYGLLSAGGTIGAVGGGLVVTGVGSLAERWSWLDVKAQQFLLLTLAALFFVAGGICAAALAKRASGTHLREVRPPKSDGPSALVGLRRCLDSPYLLAICGFLLLYTASSTVIYLERQEIVAATIDGRQGWRAFSAKLDIYTQSLSLLGQLLVTSALLKRLGIAGGLAFVPVVTMLGFGVLGGYSTLLVVGIVETCRKVCEYVVTRPSREVLYTVVPREEKYEAKVFIDTFVYRLGDVLGTGFVSFFAMCGAGTGATFLAAIPLMAAWIVVAIQLGRKQMMMQRELARRESPMVGAAT